MRSQITSAENFEGNGLIAAGDEDLVKIHFHTNEPWKILKNLLQYGCREIYDIIMAVNPQGAGLG